MFIRCWTISYFGLKLMLRRFMHVFGFNFRFSFAYYEDKKNFVTFPLTNCSNISIQWKLLELFFYFCKLKFLILTKNKAQMHQAFKIKWNLQQPALKILKYLLFLCVQISFVVTLNFQYTINVMKFHHSYELRANTQPMKTHTCDYLHSQNV